MYLKQIRNLSIIILPAVLALSILIYTSCDSGGGGSVPAADAASALDAVFSAIGVNAIGYNAGGLDGLTGTITEGGVTDTQVFTFLNCTDPLTGYRITGTLTNLITETDTLTINFSGSLSLSGAPVSNLVLDITVLMDAAAGTITRSGSLTADGTEYGFSGFDIAAGIAGNHTPPLMGVWESTDDARTLVAFVLPGNFMLPFFKNGEGGYTQEGSPVAMYYDNNDKAFKSNDGEFWISAGGFSEDGNTMTLSSPADSGSVMVYRAADSETSIDAWWQGSWNHVFQSWFGEGAETAEYSNFTFSFNLNDSMAAPVIKEGTGTYSGHMFAESSDPADEISGSADFTVDTVNKTMRINSVEAEPEQDIPTGTSSYAVMGEFLIFSEGGGTDPDPEIFILERKQ